LLTAEKRSYLLFFKLFDEFRYNFLIANEVDDTMCANPILKRAKGKLLTYW